MDDFPPVPIIALFIALFFVAWLALSRVFAKEFPAWFVCTVLAIIAFFIWLALPKHVSATPAQTNFARRHCASDGEAFAKAEIDLGPRFLIAIGRRSAPRLLVLCQKGGTVDSGAVFDLPTVDSRIRDSER